MPFTQAVRAQKKLRMALAGPSGSGKTFTALEIAKGLGDKIALIDTERGSATLYGDKFHFDTLELEYFSVDSYIRAIDEASEAGYDVLIIDSLSHAWTGQGGVLDAVNNTKGNTFTDGWGKVGTPQQNRLMDTILRCPCHVIVTLRVKTDYDVQRDDKGRATPKKIGLQPIQRDGVEYEFDIMGRMDQQNNLMIEKSRMIDLADMNFPKPTRKLGARLLAWLNSGVKPEPHVPPDDAPAFKQIMQEEGEHIRAFKESDDLSNSRVSIIDTYKAVKGVALSINLTGIVQANPATSAMTNLDILRATEQIAREVNAVLSPVLVEVLE